MNMYKKRLNILFCYIHAQPDLQTSATQENGGKEQYLEVKVVCVGMAELSVYQRNS